ERQRGANDSGGRVPLLLKISPDSSADELHSIATLLKTLPMDGVIATNTTLSRGGQGAVAGAMTGGLSGAPLHPIALKVVAALRPQLGPALPIIGVGGIHSPQAARAMREAGADLVQLYTGLIYRGPALIGQCIRAIG